MSACACIVAVDVGDGTLNHTGCGLQAQHVPVHPSSTLCRQLRVRPGHCARRQELGSWLNTRCATCLSSSTVATFTGTELSSVTQCAHKTAGSLSASVHRTRARSTREGTALTYNCARSQRIVSNEELVLFLVSSTTASRGAVLWRVVARLFLNRTPFSNQFSSRCACLDLDFGPLEADRARHDRIRHPTCQNQYGTNELHNCTML
jgi:hypothetical protein